MKIVLEDSIIEQLANELERKGRFTLQEAIILAKKYTSSKFSIFVATKAVTLVCQRYKQKTNLPPKVVIF